MRSKRALMQLALLLALGSKQKHREHIGVLKQRAAVKAARHTKIKLSK